LALNRTRILPIFLGLSAALLLPGRFLGADAILYTGASTISLSILYQGAIKGFEEKTGLRFDSVDTLSGTGKGLEKLLQGKATLCGAGRDLHPEEKSRGLVQTTIGYDALAFWVHEGNPVRNLSRANLKGILTGKVRSWKEVGGHDLAITLLLEPSGQGRASLELLQKGPMDNLPFSDNARIIDNHRAQILEVSRDPAAICVASQGLSSTFSSTVLAKVRKVAIDGTLPEAKAILSRKYPVSRPLALVTLGPPTGKVKEFVEYILSPDGQAIVEKNFVPALATRPALPSGEGKGKP